MPRSLFLKIFLWFCLVTTTVILTTFVVGELGRPDRPPPHGPTDLGRDIHAKAAADVYEQNGEAALKDYLDRLDEDSWINGYLFNERGQEISGRGASDLVRTLVQRVLQSRKPEVDHSPDAHLMARLVSSTTGANYVFVNAMPPPHPHFHPFRSQFMHMLGVGLIGAVFCYWLARYLTSPVTKLRTATQEFARGNLSVRVAHAMGDRRDELTSLGQDFDRMAEKIEALINSQRRLLGDISHELRSPLARLNVALELARQRAGADATSALERIEREAENLNEMIGQLLALTRLEGDADAISRVDLDVAELVQQVVADADFEARSGNRSVVMKSNSDCPMTGNYELLYRAIENVVRNAVHYTAEGTQVEVEVRCENSADQSGSTREAMITVRDHGPGVPEVSLSEIFRPFYRVEFARDRDSGGAGLGLAIADRAVRLHKGKITATNAPHGGLVVTIVLPTG